MKSTSLWLCTFASAALVACGGTSTPGPNLTAEHLSTEVLNGNSLHAVRNGASTTSGGANVVDHGGPVVPIFHYYTIYWGTGFEPTTKSLYKSFLTGLGDSQYWTINTQYLRGATNSASYAMSTSDTSAPPATTTDADLQAEVHKVLASGALPYDANGLYYVLTPSTVTVCAGTACSCTQFCGYHTHYEDTTYGTVLYSTIPSAAACPTVCGVFTSDADSPNGNVEADEGVSVLAHEGEETQSDALATAWYDHHGYENADKCAYKYGPSTTLNGAQVNQSWGRTSWLVQMNWSNQITGCAQQGPTDGPYIQ